MLTPRGNGGDKVPIWPDMADSFALFADTPWDWVGAGMAGIIRTNINRNQMEASARGLRIEITPRVYSDIRLMEHEALSYWSRSRK